MARLLFGHGRFHGGHILSGHGQTSLGPVSYWPYPDNPLNATGNYAYQPGANVTATGGYGVCSANGDSPTTRIVSSGGVEPDSTFNMFINISGFGDGTENTALFYARSTDGGSDQTIRIKNTQSGVADHFSSDIVVTSAWAIVQFAFTFGVGGNGTIFGPTSGVGGASYDIEIADIRYQIA